MINLKSALIIILVIINMIILIFNRLNDNNYANVLNNIYSRNINLTYSYEQLHNRYFNSLSYSGLHIEEKLNEKMKENVPGLFVRIPELVCNTCMDSLFLQLAQQYNKEDLNHVVFLVNQTNRYYFSQLKRLQGYTFPHIFETNPSEEFMSLDKYQVPYLFYLNKNFETVNVFMTEKDRMGDVKSYLSIIRKKYLNQSTVKFSIWT